MNPSETKNEVNCRAFNCILVYLEENYGEQALRDFIVGTGLTVEYLRDQNNWVSWSYYCDLMEKLVQWTGDTSSPHKAGTYSGHKKSWGYLYYVFFAFGKVGKVLQKGVEIVQRFNKAAEWELLGLSNNKATIRIRMKEGYQAKRICCESRMGQFMGIPRIFGMPLGKARETQCQAEGADSCICEITWLNRPQRIFGILGLVLSVLMLFVLNDGVPSGGSGYLEALFFLVTGYMAGRFVDYLRTNKGNVEVNQEQTAALEESVRVIETNYLALKNANDGLFALHEISRAMTSTLRLEETLNILLKMIVERLGFDRSLVMLADQETGILDRGRVYGDDSLSAFMKDLRVPIGVASPVAGEVLQNRRCRIVTDECIRGEEATELEKQLFGVSGTREYIIAPLFIEDHLLGVLAADKNRSGKDITEAEKVLMTSLANEAAVAIANAQAMKDLRHSKEIQKMTLEELQHTYDDLQKRAVVIDQINKISLAINATLDLNKLFDNIGLYARNMTGAEEATVYYQECRPGNGSDDGRQGASWMHEECLKEWQELFPMLEMQEQGRVLSLENPEKKTFLHLRDGREVAVRNLLGFPFLYQQGVLGIIPGIKYHHEKYDGAGYPEGLAGEEIPLVARIISVADTYDAITLDRPYRKAPGHDFAVEEIKRCSGTQFSPEVVQAFLNSRICRERLARLQQLSTDNLVTY